MDLVDYVLGHFSQGEKKIMEDAVKEAADDHKACVVSCIFIFLSRIPETCYYKHI